MSSLSLEVCKKVEKSWQGSCGKYPSLSSGWEKQNQMILGVLCSSESQGVVENRKEVQLVGREGHVEKELWCVHKCMFLGIQKVVWGGGREGRGHFSEF